MKKPISLGEHKKTKRRVLHANEAHQRSLSFNDRILSSIAEILGSTWVVYFFTIIALVGLIHVDSLPALIQWFTQTFVQFVALAIIQGQSNLQSRHDEARAQMMAEIAEENEKDVDLLLAHQEFQNDQISKILKDIKKLKSDLNQNNENKESI